MTEVSFAKQFLSTLDSRAINLPSDNVADPRQLPAQPAYILPKNAKPYEKASELPTSASSAAHSSAQQAAPSLVVTLKTVRSTPSTPTSLTIKTQTPQSSIYDLKSQAAKRAGYAPDKVKILWQKRPVSDSKTIAEVIGGADAKDVEMGVMFVGSPTAVPEAEEDGTGAKAGGLSNAEGAAIDAVGAASAKDTGKAGGVEGVSADAVMVDAADGAPPAAAQGVSGWGVCETPEFWDDLGSFVLQRVRDEEVAKVLISRFRGSWKG